MQQNTTSKKKRKFIKTLGTRMGTRTKDKFQKKVEYFKENWLVEKNESKIMKYLTWKKF